MKFVIAPGAIKTEIPKIAADTIKPQNADDSIGILDPIAMQIRIKESGTPLSNLAKIGFQTKGEAHMQAPRMTQMKTIAGACNICDTIQADKNVK